MQKHLCCGQTNLLKVELNIYTLIPISPISLIRTTKLIGDWKPTSDYISSQVWTRLYNEKEPIKQISAFVDNKIYITNWLYAQAGLHYVLYAPNHYKTYQSLQPRLILKATVNNKNLFYLTFLKMEQYFHHVLVSNISAPFDFIMPSIKSFKPLTAIHWRSWMETLSAHRYK